jgi:PIN domain nuclease of toxin-antitoxin system
LNPRFLVDTHVVIRWLTEGKRLSREQIRVLKEAQRLTKPVAVSAISLLEIAVLAGIHRLEPSPHIFLETLEADPLFQLLPLTYEIAVEVAALGPALKDPFDRAIVATARVHRLRLVTSDQRIIESKLVPVVE